MRGLALNFANRHQTENPRRFSEVGENKQLHIAIVTTRYFSSTVNDLRLVLKFQFYYLLKKLSQNKFRHLIC
ncbi:hypothetical protein DUT90_00180 [Polaribacter sp. WD7]|nr:hypothetical protein DUT90_00180 [Polaribacter sp. WD7]